VGETKYLNLPPMVPSDFLQGMTMKKNFPKFELGMKHAGEPFAMYFVYPRLDCNFVVTGDALSVRLFVEKYIKTHDCFYYYSFWQNGVSRGGWAGSIFIQRTDGGSGWDVHGWLTGNQAIHFRRVPNKWIPEFDTLIKPKMRVLGR